MTREFHGNKSTPLLYRQYLLLLMAAIFMLIGCVNTYKLTRADESNDDIHELIDRSIVIDNDGSDVFSMNGLCLSGGGYRAMLFNYGVLLRLNELGLLKTIDSISAVSGGAITASLLASRWNELDFDEATGVANNFRERIEPPLLKLASTSIDVPSVVFGMFSPSSAPNIIASYYDKYLFDGRTLRDFPSQIPGTPIFTINATTLATGEIWIFNRRKIGSRAIGYIDDMNLPISVALAASTALPPFLAPITLDINGVETRVEKDYSDAFMKNLPDYERNVLDKDYSEREQASKLIRQILDHRISLVDGGVIDNYGSNRCFSTNSPGIVSDAGIASNLYEDSRTDWFSVAEQSANIMHNHVHGYIRDKLGIQSNRYSRTAWQKDILINKYKTNEPSDISCNKFNSQKLYYIQLNDFPADASERLLQRTAARSMTVSEDSYSFSLEKTIDILNSDWGIFISHLGQAVALASIPTRLKSIDECIQQNIINLGYVLTESVVGMNAQNLLNQGPNTNKGALLDDLWHSAPPSLPFAVHPKIKNAQSNKISCEHL